MISNSFKGDDLNDRVGFQITTEFGDINIQVAGVKEGVIAPDFLEYCFPVDCLVTVFIEDLKELSFPVR